MQLIIILTTLIMLFNAKNFTEYNKIVNVSNEVNVNSLEIYCYEKYFDETDGASFTDFSVKNLKENITIEVPINTNAIRLVGYLPSINVDKLDVINQSNVVVTWTWMPEWFDTEKILLERRYN